MNVSSPHIIACHAGKRGGAATAGAPQLLNRFGIETTTQFDLNDADGGSTTSALSASDSEIDPVRTQNKSGMSCRLTEIRPVAGNRTHLMLTIIPSSFAPTA